VEKSLIHTAAKEHRDHAGYSHSHQLPEARGIHVVQGISRFEAGREAEWRCKPK
jgi:hypothetical protein